MPATVKMIQTGFRIPKDVLDRIDRRVREMSLERPGHSFSRADLVRQFVLEGLDRLERTRKPKAERSTAKARKKIRIRSFDL